MRTGESMKSVRVKVPATTANLGPGFDCLGVALSIYNYIHVEQIGPGAKNLEISVKGQGEKSINRDENNLVYKSIKQVFDKAGRDIPNLKIELQNNIPLARGLGSSAACIAGAVTAANYLLGCPFSLDKLVDLAVEIEGHPDNVVPAILGGSVASCMDNGKAYYTRFPIPKPVNFIAAVPDFYLTTQKARQVLPEKLDYSDAVFNVGRTAILISSLIAGDFENLSIAVKDRLHQPYRSSLIPGMNQVIEEVEKAGAYCGYLSGAGPTIIGISHPDKAVQAGDAMSYAFLKNNIRSKIIITRISDEGAIIE
jgi:homoserine kinase